MTTLKAHPGGGLAPRSESTSGWTNRGGLDKNFHLSFADLQKWTEIILPGVLFH